MAKSLKDLREPTLDGTYIKLNAFIRSANKEEVDRLISCEGNLFDAFDDSIRVIIVDRLKLHSHLSKILFEVNEQVISRAVKCKW